VFENRVQRKLIAHKKNEVAGGEVRRLRNEELYDLHLSPNIIRVIKSRKMRWAGHLARMGRNGTYGILLGKPEREGARRRIILKWLLEE
jgi:hypothetical protein